MLRFLTTVLCIIFSVHSYAQQSYVIKNVNVIPMSSDTVLQNRDVTVKGKMISSIVKTGNNKYHGATVINGTGKYLMPGLFDMHTHFFYEQGEHINTNALELKLMLANGITTARIMAGHPSYLQARENVKTNQWAGPELFVASPQFAGEWPFDTVFKNYELVTNPLQAREAVKKYKLSGYDLIKITFKVNRETYDAIIDESRKQNIKVTGHVGPKVSLFPALSTSQQIEHMDEFIEYLLPDTSYNHGQSVSDYNIYSKKAWATVPFLDESKIGELAKKVKEANIYVTPTNYFFISFFGHPEDSAFIRQKPDLQFLPASMQEEKWSYKRRYELNMAPQESRDKYVRIRKDMVKALWNAGVPLMAGSDSPEFFIVAGLALHDELATMVDAGLSNYAALQTGTVNPATYLGIANRTGTIEEGKEADMILLNKSPLENIRNTRTIEAVFKDGLYYDSGRIRELLYDAAALQKN